MATPKKPKRVKKKTSKKTASKTKRAKPAKKAASKKPKKRPSDGRLRVGDEALVMWEGESHKAKLLSLDAHMVEVQLKGGPKRLHRKFLRNPDGSMPRWE